jgi:hypothetical protein
MPLVLPAVEPTGRLGRLVSTTPDYCIDPCPSEKRAIVTMQTGCINAKGDTAPVVLKRHDDILEEKQLKKRIAKDTALCIWIRLLQYSTMVGRIRWLK